MPRSMASWVAAPLEDGLDEVINGALAQTPGLVRLLVLGRHSDDWNARHSGIALQGTHGPEAIEDRHDEVRQDEIRMDPLGRTHALLPVDGRLHAKPRLPQGIAEDERLGRRVIHDQCRRRSPGGNPGLPGNCLGPS